MNREQAKILSPIIKEWADGGQLQYSDGDGGWYNTDYLNENGDCLFRIKPGPREYWIDPCDLEVFEQANPPHPNAIKVREVIE